ncbi:hypothetical protein D9M71_634780 [compost metagenome]
MAQQLPIQRGEDCPFECRLMPDLLDQQIRLHVGHIIDDVLFHIFSPRQLRGHCDPPAMQRGGLLIEPVAMGSQAILTKL